MEGGKGPLSKEDEPQKGAKEARVIQTLVDKKSDSKVRTLTWTPTISLDGTPLPADALIRDFQQGRVGYMADAVEQALLLPGDTVNLRSMRKHEAVQSTHRAEEIVNSSHRVMKDEEARCIAAVEAFRVVDRKAQELTTKLTEAGREKKNAEAALDGAEKQAEAQRKQLY
ncbi:hypothetical protein SO802_031642 [Lithocarpus litseifolius]|uniref:Uncharacterized protein n=1 Tax=Lithocarpus litseifolius TaxID=425828 RepID=A0AAW2BL74_9ROSI